MPKQSKRNQHLQKARETKKLKIIEPITDEYIDKEVFENESRLEIEESRETNIYHEVKIWKRLSWNDPTRSKRIDGNRFSKNEK
ncbi:11809_t:CDS:2 [Entrophospora sp. SA101]|nr:11809_t:CDS:2 [Entrophospora sp. SA101]